MGGAAGRPRIQYDSLNTTLPYQILILAMMGQQSLATELARSREKDGPCAKCDGPHHEAECPHFAGTREEWETWAHAKGVIEDGGVEETGGEIESATVLEVKGQKATEGHAHGL